MKSSTWLFAAAMSVSGLVMAQTNPGVTEITDPAKISAIEQHAQELAARGQTTPAMGEHDMNMDKGGMHHKKHRAMRHRAMKNKATDKAKDKAAPDTPMATESKG
jgi:uncharacterized protein involved in copper resistance